MRYKWEFIVNLRPNNITWYSSNRLRWHEEPQRYIAKAQEFTKLEKLIVPKKPRCSEGNMNLFGNLLSPLNNCPPGERVPEMSPQHLKFMSFFKAPDPPEIPAWEIGLKIAFYIPSIVINLVGNSLVILILAFNKKMRTTTNLLILNLSVSDILIACFCSWIHLVSQVTAGNQWIFGAFMCKFTSFAQGKS